MYSRLFGDPPQRDLKRLRLVGYVDSQGRLLTDVTGTMEPTTLRSTATA